MEQENNMKYLGRGYYLCRTQAGFRKAVKHFNGKYADEDDWDPVKKQCIPRPVRDVRGYPHSYPSLVHITNEHVGSCYSFTRASCTPISWARAAILPLIFRLFKSDRQEKVDFT